MRRYRKFTAALLALALSVSPAMAKKVDDYFPAQNQYPGYADVAVGSWYQSGAELCYEIGLITGSHLGFEPNRHMTLAEVATIAARMAQAISGEKIPENLPQPGETLFWYTPYVEYLKALGATGLDRPEDLATRSDFLSLLAIALPHHLLSPINSITSLPDSSDAQVLAFYNAGILTGVDQFGTFDGGKSLTRAEGAAMVGRIARTELRKTFTPQDYAPFAAAKLRPEDVLFVDNARQVTASHYLPVVMGLIAHLEKECAAAGIEFNWFHTYGEQTFLEYVKSTALGQFSVTKDMGTALYQGLDLQVFYSRYLDIKGMSA